MKFYPSPIPPNGWPGQKPVKREISKDLSLKEALDNIDGWDEDDYLFERRKYASSQHQLEAKQER